MTRTADVFLWSDGFAIGLGELDAQHRKLIEILNRLAQHHARHATDVDLLGVFDELLDYTTYHFRTEEALMAEKRVAAEHAAVHVRAHREFVERVAAARASAEKEPRAVTGHILSFLTKWLILHILGIDRRLGEEVRKAEERDALPVTVAAAPSSERTVAVLLEAMDRLYSKLGRNADALFESNRKLQREVAERRTTNARLRKLERAVASSPMSILVTDREGIIEFANPKCSEITGYANAEIVGQNPRLFQSESTPIETYRQLWASILGGEQWTGELLNRKKNGELFWERASISPISDESGAITHFVAIKEDITRSKQAERELHDLNRDFVSFLENTSDFIYFKDRDSRFRFCSQTLAAITGRASWRDLIGKHDLDVFPADTAQVYSAEELPIFRDGTPLLNKVDPYYDADGRPGWVSTNKWPLFDDEGKAVVGIFGISRDITAHMRTEAALRESETRLRSLIENSPLCIHEIDLNGRIASMNKSGLLMMGVATEAQVQGLPYLDAVGSEDRERIRDLLVKAYDGETSHFEFKASGGGDLIFKSCFVPIKDETGKVSRLMGITENITERKLAESYLHIAATAFEAQEGMVVTDAGGVIQRVNRAFTAITGYSAEEAVGRTSRLLKSGRHDGAYYAKMWAAIGSSGTWQGEIWNRRKNGELYPEWLTITAVKGDGGEVTHYVATMTDITRRKEAEEEIRQLAFFDPLTQLPNRRLLHDRLQHALLSCARNQRRGALLFIDLDNFKNLNDTLGHDMGDHLLEQVARRLTACIREGDTVARLGGDEFVVVLEDLSAAAADAAAETTLVGEKIRLALNQPYQFADAEHHSTPSIGATLFGDHKETVEDLLKQADMAMYQAKAAGRNTLRFFDPQMQAAVTARAAMESELRRGVQEGQFVLYYQPQVDRDGRLTGAEALLRWRHPLRGIVAPAEFIPLAEETGLILPLGYWVIETACAQLAAWATRAGTAALTLAVNVSARQFRHPDFVAQVTALIAGSGADAHRLKLELTESLLLDDVDETIAKMTALKARGVGFALDDFGTGYSSLSYLKRLPLDQLKIDQSFVRDVLTDANDAAIARTIVALATNLGLAVIAEGVETEAQRVFLAGHGCHAYQGYLFDRPLPLAEFERMMQRR